MLEVFYNKFIYWGQNSVTGKFFGACGRRFDKMVANSLIFSFLGRRDWQGVGESSLFWRIILKIFAFFPFVGEKLFAGRNSVICSYVKSTVGSWHTLPLPWLGSLILPLAVLGFKVMGVLGAVPLLAAGILLLLLPLTLSQIIAGSRVISWCCQPCEPVEAENIKHFYVIPFVFALVCSAAGLLWGALTGAAIFCLLLGACVMICYPVTGVMLLFFCAPFLPTMVMVALSLGLLCCFLVNRMITGNKLFPINTSGVLIALFALLLLIYGFNSYAPGDSMKVALVYIAFIIPFFLIYWELTSASRVRVVIFLFCLSALGCGIIGLYQYLSGDINTTWTNTELFEGLKLRIYSVFNNPNVYGEYLLFALPLAGVMTYVAKKPLMKVFYGGTSLLLLLNLALTYSRGCYLALMFGCFLGVCWGARRLLVLAPLALAAIPFVMPDSIMQRFTSIINFTDHSTSYRVNIWLGTINMLENFWLLGIGLGRESFDIIYSRYQLHQVFAPHSHNLFLEITTEVGFAGLLLFIGIMLVFFVSCYHGHKTVKGTKASWLLVAMMSATGAYLFEGIFEFIWYNYKVFLIFFMYLALAQVVAKLCRNKGLKDLEGNCQKAEDKI